MGWSNSVTTAAVDFTLLPHDLECFSLADLGPFQCTLSNQLESVSRISSIRTPLGSVQ